MRRSWLTLLIVAAFLGVATLQVFAAQRQDPTNGHFDSAADWAYSLNVQTNNNYLNYPSSGLTGLASVQVAYLPNTSRAFIGAQGQQYTDFWFHANTVIGCRRYMTVSLRPGSMGLIIVQPADSSNTRAVVDVIMRLLVEINLANASVLEVMVPQGIFPQMATDLNQFAFYPVTLLKGTSQGHLLHLVSYPAGLDQYFYFGNPG